MKTCRKMIKDWTADFLSAGTVPEGSPHRKHVESCAVCREEAERLRRILNRADHERAKIQKEMDSIDWAALPEKIADRAFRESAAAVCRRQRAGFPQWLPVRPVFAALALGLVLGAAGMYLAVKRPAPGLSVRGDYFASPGFIDRIEQTLARREAIDYLERSQDLLLDFLQAADAEGPERGLWPAPDRVRELLGQKKYLNAHFESPRMAQAKAVCDQIELLFMELFRLAEGLTAEETARIRSFIEDRQLLLNIRLAKRELQKSEV
ncbi:MAG: hypothetical protein SCM96_07665 [Acidobacteriota bacterium]|nr:hypothetical protein [Acidobacteriota bacterium]